MKLLTPDELIVALRIFNRVVGIVEKQNQNYHKKKILGEIKDFVSRNRWIMFPVGNILSLREGVDSPTPNIYMSFHNDIQDDGMGRVNGWIGLTFGNNGAMQWLEQLLSKKNVYNFMAILNSLNKDWSVEITQKIKTNYFEATPNYEPYITFKAADVTAGEIKSNIIKSNKTLPLIGVDHKTGPVIAASTIVTAWKETTELKCDDDVENAFKLFFKVLSLR